MEVTLENWIGGEDLLKIRLNLRNALVKSPDYVPDHLWETMADKGIKVGGLGGRGINFGKVGTLLAKASEWEVVMDKVLLDGFDHPSLPLTAHMPHCPH